MICLRLLTLLRLPRLLRSRRLLRMVQPPVLRRQPLRPRRQVRRRLRPPLVTHPPPLRAQAMAVWAVLRRMARLVTPRRMGVPQLALLSLLRLRSRRLLLLLPLQTLRLPLALIRRLLRVPAVRMAVLMAEVRARVTRAARVRTLRALSSVALRCMWCISRKGTLTCCPYLSPYSHLPHTCQTGRFVRLSATPSP